MSETWWLPLIVVGNVGLTLYVWQIVRRGPKRRFLNKLLLGKPIVPKHARPAHPRYDRLSPRSQFLSDFEGFGEALNELRLRETPWRVQEEPTLAAAGAGPDSLGRRYSIFFNQIPVGYLQVANALRYTASNPEVTTEVRLSFARLLPFKSIREFVESIASLTAASTGDEFRIATSKLYDAAVDELWQIEYDRDLDDRALGGDLHLAFKGLAATYLQIPSARRATA